MPADFERSEWNEPKFIDIPSRDGKQIKSKIYLPTGFDKSKKYPMVIFVHGAGYLQNTINGWNNYYREFMFNELLTQKGYVVLDIDYRGSAGYGREWRTDVYDFLGGKDYDDQLDALDFMIKNYAVDAKRVGVYGGSYGGFMAEMLAFRAPEKIAAAAALRPVADWKNYYASSPGYTAQRLGFPDKNPEAYKRSSPITYADGLKNASADPAWHVGRQCSRSGFDPADRETYSPRQNTIFRNDVLSVGKSRLCAARELDRRVRTHIGLL